jgi:predicted flap endonuclease-1-like 5' DNA nuclease
MKKARRLTGVSSSSRDEGKKGTAMLYLIHSHWIWLLLAATLGVGIGWSTCGEQRGGGLGGWFVPAALVFGLGLVASLFRLAPGRFGYWLDIALLNFAAYLIGCCLGCLAGGRGRPQPVQVDGSADMARPLSAVVDIAATAPQTQPDLPGHEALLARLVEADARSPGVLEGGHPGRRPSGLATPRHGLPDDLKRIKGIGPQNERRLQALGIWHFDQIATWTGENIVWIASFLKFPGRIERENWVAQAKILASGGITEFAKRVDAGKVPTSRGDPDPGRAG